MADPAFAGTVRYPAVPEIERFGALYMQALALHGSPFCATAHRALLREAGFERSEGQALAVTGGTPEAARKMARLLLTLHRETASPVALEHGWTTQQEVDAISEAIVRWGEHPDAFVVNIRCCTLAWAPPS